MKWLTFVAAVALAATPVLADWNVGDPYKMHWPQLPDPLGWDVYATNPNVAADDWQCTGTGPVDDVHFWGSWKDDVFGGLQGFNLSIHADVPAQPGIPSHPGALLWSETITNFGVRQYDPPSQEGWFDPSTGTVLPNNHQHYFQYNITHIPNPYVQTVNTIYWLDISAIVVPGTGQWGWKTSSSLHFNDDAVWGVYPNPQWVDLHDPLNPTHPSLDLAFVITPEPTTMLLLGFGAMMLRRRR